MIAKDAFFEFKAWLRHLMKAGGPHHVHSPLVFRLLTEVLVPKKKDDAFRGLNAMRQFLQKDETSLSVEDFGAGSRHFKPGNNRKISQIAKQSLQKPRCAEALFCLVRDLQPSHGIELGTSVGLTTAYLAMANQNCQWTSIEGSPDLAAYARNLLNKLSVKNASILTGNFDVVLPDYCSAQRSIDFAYIDGNHKYEPTLRYFQALSKLADENSVFIFDDIHWSEEMEKAWNEIQNSDQVSVSIDFFHFGMVYFRKGIEKQKFILRLP